MVKNVQGVCAPSVNPKFDPDPFWDLREDYKELEQVYMMLLDKYGELAQMLGIQVDPMFGDPLAPHKDIVNKLTEVVEKAWMYDELN